MTDLSACCEAARRIQTGIAPLEGYACPIHGTQWIPSLAKYAEMAPKQPENDAFRTALRQLLNVNSKENASDTPDFILALYLENCLKAFDLAVQQRTAWHKPSMKPGQRCTIREDSHFNKPHEWREQDEKDWHHALELQAFRERVSFDFRKLVANRCAYVEPEQPKPPEEVTRISYADPPEPKKRGCGHCNQGQVTCGACGTPWQIQKSEPFTNSQVRVFMQGLFARPLREDAAARTIVSRDMLEFRGTPIPNETGPHCITRILDGIELLIHRRSQPLNNPQE